MSEKDSETEAHSICLDTRGGESVGTGMIAHSYNGENESELLASLSATHRRRGPQRTADASLHLVVNG